MRLTIVVVAVASLTIGPSLAHHGNPPVAVNQGETALPQSFDRNPESGNPAIKTTEGNSPGAPTTGANSFTEAQAKSRIESKGFNNVSALEMDDNGIWRGTAIKDGNADKNAPPVNISLDYQGNVVSN